jgi:hypothetical protein
MVAAMLLTATSAFAAANITFAWDNCLSDGGAANKVFACGANTGSNTAVGTFELAAPITGATGIEVVIDLISATSLPAWWEFNENNLGTPFTGCRSSSLSASPSIPGTAANCIDWSASLPNGGLAGTNRVNGSIAPSDTAAHRRILIGFAVGAPGNDLVANTEYFGFVMTVNHAKTVGTGSCGGCLTPVCLVLNSVCVAPGAAECVKISDTVIAGSNFITWQGGVGANCQSVPTRNATWGQVKALYH